MATLNVTTEKGTKTLVYGDVVVTKITPSPKTPGWSTITLEQTVKSVYQGSGEQSNFLLQNLTEPSPLEFESIRTNSQRVKDAVADKFTIGQIVPGMYIKRTKHKTAQYEGHTASTNDGKFYTTELCQGAIEEDIDLTEGVFKSTVVNAHAEIAS